MNLRWTATAQEDVDAYTAWIQRDNQTAAANWQNRAQLKARQASQFPESGRIVPEFDQGDLRELFVASHRLIYQVRADEVVVLRVYHSARKLSARALWGEEE